MKPYRIRPYHTVGGYLLIHMGWQSYWYPTIDAAMDYVAALAKLRAI